LQLAAFADPPWNEGVVFFCFAPLLIAVSGDLFALTPLLLIRRWVCLQRYHSVLNLACRIFVAVLILHEIGKIQKEIRNEKKKETNY